jgi:hypothetical protein
LKHELLDDTVKARSLVVKSGTRFSGTLFTSTKSTEVLGSDGDNIGSTDRK